jgi:hypothetical protein
MRFPLLLPTLLFCLLATRPAAALRIESQISVSMQTVPSETQDRLAGLREKLETYINEFDWDESDPKLVLNLPVAIQIKSAGEIAGQLECSATFACNNSGDISIQENNWRFRYDEYAEFQHSPDSFNSLVGLVDFYMHLLIGHELDKLGEEAGTEHFTIAARIGDRAKFDELNDGWDQRMEDLGMLLSPDRKDYRTLRWVTHNAWYFQDVVRNRYEAWLAIVTAIDLAERLDNTQLLQRYWQVNHRRIAELLVLAGDRDNLNRVRRLDNTDPTRMTFYQDKVASIAE